MGYWTCEHCRTKNEPGKHCCSKCGRDRSGTAAAAPDPAPERTEKQRRVGEWWANGYIIVETTADGWIEVCDAATGELSDSEIQAAIDKHNALLGCDFPAASNPAGVTGIVEDLVKACRILIDSNQDSALHMTAESMARHILSRIRITEGK